MTGGDAARVFSIEGGRSESDMTPALVGGKAANLARLDRLGLAVPPAIVLPTSLCRRYLERGTLPDDVRPSLAGSLRQIERATGCTLGGSPPLLVSVRSSPPSSMPGMLRTVVNVGTTEDTALALTRRTGNPWQAWDVYRRFVRSFGEAAGQCPAQVLDRIEVEQLGRAQVARIDDLDAIELRRLARDTAAAVARHGGRAIPTDPLDQLVAAVEAVFASWNAPAAVEYRRINGLEAETGTAALIQAMAFGNAGTRSGSGVCFTRNPATGARELYVDFAFNAQGDDVVGGRETVQDAASLAARLPDAWAQLTHAAARLEREFGDMQDVEFTIEEGVLFFLQCRSGKRTPWAALQIAVDLVQEGVIDAETARARLERVDLEAIRRVTLRPDAGTEPIGRATAASVGVASGAVVFDADRASALGARTPVVLVRDEMSTDDLRGLAASVGVLTASGGRTSHAAVVARQLGRVCLVGCGDLHIDQQGATCTIGPRRLCEGDVVTLDGEAGAVYAGKLPVVTERPAAALAIVRGWPRHVECDRSRTAVEIDSFSPPHEGRHVTHCCTPDIPR
ncbi:MAG TPA: PEP/pyruvate-binding domain-containing protein [Vicinamibacterales bacterium]|nr:PEP/pyruvate-binding domain-containing protein [Vicinamibacterales bacterium]